MNRITDWLEYTQNYSKSLTNWLVTVMCEKKIEKSFNYIMDTNAFYMHWVFFGGRLFLGVTAVILFKNKMVID